MDKEEFATEDMKSVMSKIMHLIDESEQDFPLTPLMTERSYHQSIASESSVQSVQYQELANLSKLNEIHAELTPSPTKKISTKQFLNKTLARMNNRTQKGLEQLKKTKEKAEEEFNAVCTHKPFISDTNKTRVKEQAPFHERYQNYIQEKNRKLSEITAKVTEEREKILEKDLTFKPKITKFDERKRTIQQIAKGCKDWKAKKAKELDMLREKILDDEKQSLTFKPELNQRSVEIWLKLKEENKLPEKFMIDKTKSTKFINAQRDSKKDLLFRPKIRKSHASLNKSCLENSVFERLFQGGNCKLLNNLVSNPLLTSNSSLNTSIIKTDRSAFLRSNSHSYNENPSPDPHNKLVQSRHKMNASIYITTSYEHKSYIKPNKSERTLKPESKSMKKIIEKPKPEQKPTMTRSSTTPRIVPRKPQSNAITEDEFQAAKLRMEAARLENNSTSSIDKINSILISSIQEEKTKYSDIIHSNLEVHETTESVITDQTENTLTASENIETHQEDTRNILGDKIDYLRKAVEEGVLSKNVFSSCEVKNPSNIYTQSTKELETQKERDLSIEIL